MNKFFLLFIAIIFVQSAMGQKNEISEAEFLAKETYAAEILVKSSHRLIKTLEYFEDRGKTARVAERHLSEVLLPNKWRKIEETDFNDVKRREERIWDGKSLFVRVNDGEWERSEGGSSFSDRIESGKVTKTYRYLGKKELKGSQVDLYQVQSLRVANKFSANDLVVVRFVRNTHYWFAPGGKLVRKVEETMIEGRNEMSRETTEIEYDPKISIEAPIK